MKLSRYLWYLLSWVLNGIFYNYVTIHGMGVMKMLSSQVVYNVFVEFMVVLKFIGLSELSINSSSLYEVFDGITLSRNGA